jgi:hypothetical protein
MRWHGKIWPLLTLLLKEEGRHRLCDATLHPRQSFQRA